MQNNEGTSGPTSPSTFLPHQVSFLSSQPETRDVSTFRFSLGKDEFDWRAGQFLEMAFPGLEDPRGSTRLFTISSSPTEKGSLTISTKRGESPFKVRLRGLRVGDLVDIKAPDGDFVLDHARPAVMVAGGLGITPFRSMLRYATDTKLEQPLVLVYSNKTPEEIVFRRELDDIAGRNRLVRILHTITRPQESKETWTGRIGRVDANLIHEALHGLHHPLVYVAGPPGLVREHRRLLIEENHLPEVDLRTDEFEGY